MKFHPHIIACFLCLSFSAAFAQDTAVVGEVIAGEQGYEVAVEVENWKDEPLTNVSVRVTNPPEDLVNIIVTPQLVGSLAAGEIATFIIYFDVAEDAVEDDIAQEFVELAFSVTAEGTEFDQPHPSISLAITQRPDAQADKDVGPEDQGSLQAGPYVYVLTDISVQDINWTEGAMSFQTEHQENQLGYLQRTKSAAHTEIKMVNCKDCPTQIVLGKPMHFQLETRTRYDSRVYHCDSMPGDRAAPQLVLGSNIGFEANTKGKALHFPSCQELGITLSELKGPANLPAIPTMASVGLTRDESVSLTADFRFTGDATDYDAVFYNDPTFGYEAEYSSSGRLSDEKKIGIITVAYSNTRIKTSEYLEKNEIVFSFSQLRLTYSLQVNDEPRPISVTAFGTPAEFGSQHLDSAPVLAEGRSPEESEPPQTGEDIVENEVDLPDVIGMPYQRAVAAIEAAGLVALPPELGSNAPNPAHVGRVELALPAVDGQLHRGDKISLRLFGEAITGATTPDVVGLGIREAARAVEEAGFIPAFELGAETADAGKDQTIASQFPVPGLVVENGTQIKLIVFTLAARKMSIPDLRGMALSEAKQLLQREGLNISPELGESAPNNSRIGRVYSQSPAPGQEVESAISVTVLVYAEPAAVVLEEGSCRSGYEWDELMSVCVDNLPAAQVARFDCSAYPGAFPQWDETLEQPQCLCPSGWFWSKSEQRCLDTSPRAQLARADCSFAGRYVKAYWNYDKEEVRCRCLDSYYYNDDKVCVREPLVQRQEPPVTPRGNDDGWQKAITDLATILSGINSASNGSAPPSGQRTSPKPSGSKNCATDFTVRNISNFDCNCPGWGFDPRYAKCRKGFSDKYSSNPTPESGKVRAGFGNSSGSGGNGHLCTDTSVRTDAYVTKYAPMYGGGETAFAMKGDIVCYNNAYDRVLSGSVESYTCREKNFGGCSRQKTMNIDRREDRGGGAYKLVFNGGNLWWIISPE